MISAALKIIDLTVLEESEYYQAEIHGIGNRSEVIF